MRYLPTNISYPRKTSAPETLFRFYGAAASEDSNRGERGVRVCPNYRPLPTALQPRRGGYEGGRASKEGASLPPSLPGFIIVPPPSRTST